MIDSSGHKLMRVNGTILDFLPISKVLGVGGALLVVLFTVVKPEASHGLGTASRSLFWALHIGLGLGVIWVISRWMASRERLPAMPLPAVLVTGIVGALIAVPGYRLLDLIYVGSVIDLNPDSPSTSIMNNLVAEFFELAPWFMTSWIVINLPVLLPRPDPQITLDDSVSAQPPIQTTIEIQDPHTTDSTAQEHVDKTGAHQNNNTAPQKFLQSLPGIVGTDIIAVSSDLHYLNVWTVAGRTTVLGNLKDVIDELNNIGLQVHRSHWVAYSHVRRIVGTANNAACILSNELRIPISRRKWKETREHFGRGVVKTLDS